MNEIFMLYHIWFDWMENRPSAAVGYSAKSYVTDEDVAKRIVAEAGVCTGKECWAATKGEPKMRYEVLTPYPED